MKLNNKGFTLVELLAVVVIMLAISVMAVSSISSSIERNKKKQTAAKIKVIESSAEVYYNDHKNPIILSEKGCLSLGKLGLSDKEMRDADGNIFNGCISLNDNTFLTYVTTGCSSCY